MSPDDLDEEQGTGNPQPGGDDDEPQDLWCRVMGCIEASVREGLCKAHAIKARKGDPVALEARKRWHFLHDPPTAPPPNGGWRHRQKTPAPLGGPRPDGAPGAQDKRQSDEPAVLPAGRQVPPAEPQTANEENMAMTRDRRNEAVKCSDCGQLCVSRAGLAVHRAAKHNEPGTAKQARQASKAAAAAAPTGPVPCVECSRTFATYGAMAIHRSRIHGQKGLLRDVSSYKPLGPPSGSPRPRLDPAATLNEPAQRPVGTGRKVIDAKSPAAAAANAATRGVGTYPSPESYRDRTAEPGPMRGFLDVAAALGIIDQFRDMDHTCGRVVIHMPSGRMALLKPDGKAVAVELVRADPPSPDPLAVLEG